MLKSSTLPATITIAGVLALIGYAIVQHLAAGRDDTFIMLWAGQSLGSAPWFINYNYATQEIASSIIGVLIAALTSGQPVGQALLIVKFLGLLSACMVLYLIWWRRSDIFADSTEANWLALATIVATAASPVFMYWSMGGLETPHHALLLLAYSLVLLISVTFRARQSGLVDWWVWIIGLLLVLVRTEGFWPIFFAGAWLMLVSRVVTVPAQAFRAVFLTVASFVLLLILRYVFTGAIWPNPVYAKVGNYASAMPAGLDYLFKYFISSPWTWVHGLACLYGTARFVEFSVFAILRRDVSRQALLYEALLGGFVLFHLIFVVLTGGSWMEYFRFMAAIVPLMNILSLFFVFSLVKLFTLEHLFPLVALMIGLFSLLQNVSKYVGDCAAPIANISRLSEAVIQNNCAHARDSRAIQPFIDELLPSFLDENNGRLTIASYQAGFFPYHLRKRYSTSKVWFIDTAGLNDLEIARIPTGKSSGGIQFRDRIDLALMGKAGPISEYFSSRTVNLIYLLSATEEVRKNFLMLGFKTVWDVDDAVVFYRPSHP